MAKQNHLLRNRLYICIVAVLLTIMALSVFRHHHRRYVRLHVLVYHLKDGRFVCHKPVVGGSKSMANSRPSGVDNGFATSDTWYVLTQMGDTGSIGDYRSSSRLGGTLPRGTGWTAAKLSPEEMEEVEEDSADIAAGKDAPDVEEETACVDNESGEPAADNDVAESDSSAADSSGATDGGGDSGGGDGGGGDGGGD